MRHGLTLGFFGLFSLAACGAPPSGEDAASTSSAVTTRCPVGTVYECTNGVCKCAPMPPPPPPPRPFATTTAAGAPIGVVADATNVYFATQDGKVMSCPQAGCGSSGPTELASDPGWQPTYLLADAQNLYWLQETSGGTGIMRCAKTGCGGQPTAIAYPGAAVSIAIDADNIYWTDERDLDLTSGSIRSCPKTGCVGSPRMVYAHGLYPTSLAVDSTSVYWLDGYDEADLLTCPVTGCVGEAPTYLAKNVLQNPFRAALAIDSANVYVVGDGNLLRCSKTGCLGGATTLASGGAIPADTWAANVIATDGQNVYWSTGWTDLTYSTGAGSLLKCAVGGCGGTPTTLASSSDPFYGVALDATHVYWTDVGSTEGSLWRAAK